MSAQTTGWPPPAQAADSVTAPAAGAVAHTISDAQIEAMPVWRNFVGLWPESRREIVDAVVDLLTTTPPAQVTDSVLKDHQIAALVNELRDIAIQYYGTQQLRERIAHAVVPALKGVLEDAARLDWLLLHISGAEFRRIGVHYSGNARRADVDAARKQGENHD